MVCTHTMEIQTPIFETHTTSKYAYNDVPVIYKEELSDHTMLSTTVLMHSVNKDHLISLICMNTRHVCWIKEQLIMYMRIYIYICVTSYDIYLCRIMVHLITYIPASFWCILNCLFHFRDPALHKSALKLFKVIQIIWVWLAS